MHQLVAWIEQYGLIVVFFNVLLTQAGAPLPAYPLLLIAGAFAVRGDFGIAPLLTVAVAASLIADFLWFWAGARFGRRVLKTLCQMSLSPDSCVRQTESIYARWGAPSLLVAKFIPGFAAVATTLAGIVGTRRASFALFDGLGAALWASVAILLGALFHNAVNDIIAVLQSLGKWGMVLLGAALVAFVLSKWWQRRRFYKSLRMARISVHELNRLRESGSQPTILDVRSALSQQDGRIPGALPMSDAELDGEFADIPMDGEVIVYCACPNEASAARLAKQLMQRGFKRVRPLEGGIEAWIAAGYEVEK